MFDQIGACLLHAGEYVACTAQLLVTCWAGDRHMAHGTWLHTVWLADAVCLQGDKQKALLVTTHMTQICYRHLDC
jgi:hypothetical protein